MDASIPSCPEGEIVDGKAGIVKENFCVMGIEGEIS